MFWDIVTVLTIALVAFLIIRSLPNILRWIGRFFRPATSSWWSWPQGQGEGLQQDRVQSLLPTTWRPFSPVGAAQASPGGIFRRNRAFLRELKREENPEENPDGYGFMRQLALEAGGEAWKLKESDSPGADRQAEGCPTGADAGDLRRNL